jgi:hypothetical protein
VTKAELAWYLGMAMIQPKYISNYVWPLVEEIAGLHRSQRRDVFFNLIRFAREYRHKFPGAFTTRRWTMTLPQDMQRARNLAVHYMQQQRLPSFVRWATVVETILARDIFDKLDLKLPDNAGTSLSRLPTPPPSPRLEQQEGIEIDKQTTDAHGMAEVDMVKFATAYPRLRVTIDECEQLEKLLSQRNIA